MPYEARDAELYLRAYFTDFIVCKSGRIFSGIC